jgi:hypothetical protein
VATWKDVESSEPEFAERVRRVFDAHVNKIIATVRADGSPRVSGIEAQFADGELSFGSMPGARKGADLRRDPRFALHSASPDPPADNQASWPGDAKISGRAVYGGPVDGEQPGDRFTADIRSVVLTRLNDTASALVIESWQPGGGLRRVERA